MSTWPRYFITCGSNPRQNICQIYLHQKIQNCYKENFSLFQRWCSLGKLSWSNRMFSCRLSHCRLRDGNYDYANINSFFLFPWKSKVRESHFWIFSRKEKVAFTHTFFLLFTGSLKFSRAYFWIFSRVDLLFHGKRWINFGNLIFTKQLFFYGYKKRSNTSNFMKRVSYIFHVYSFLFSRMWLGSKFDVHKLCFH